MLVYTGILLLMKAILFALIFFLVSCASTDSIIDESSKNAKESFSAEARIPRQKPLKLTFAGDIMAHNVNYEMDNYSLIYEDVFSLLHADDISFANFETPVCDELPDESYPTFNVNSRYALAAINGGFEAFSLANNHTNDQGMLGIKSTKDFFQSMKSAGVYSAGIKTGEGISYDVITVQGWTILFAAVTEIVNIHEDLDAFDVYFYTEKRRSELKADITTLQSEHPHDIFVLGVHVYEPEYDTRVTEKRKTWFYELLDAGVDIVWGNHPHVTQEWELIKSEEGDKLIMYSIGNTISGQNYYPNYDDPLHRYEDTGTSIFLHADIKDTNTHENLSTNAIGNVVLSIHLDTTIIAAHKDEHNNMLIKRLTPEFIQTQNKKHSDYYTVRLQDMEQITGTTIWR